MVFEPNVGQAPPQAAYVSRARGYQLLFAPEGVSAKFPNSELRLNLEGASPAASITASERQSGVSNYFVGSFREKGVPHFGRIAYRKVYPGIDWVFYGKQGRLEFDFVLAAGADPRAIRLRVEGATPQIEANGGLRLADGVVLEKPVLYQQAGGKRVPVNGAYRLQGQVARFDIGEYDSSRELVIDPVLSYSTFLGGSGTDTLNGFAVDTNGNAYLAGTTDSANFPTASALQGSKAASTDVFVTKLNAQGGIAYSTYIGGDQADRGNGVAVDSSGNAYVAGVTESSNFPLQNPYSSTGRLTVTKLTSAGVISYSTRIPAATLSESRAIAVDGAGQAVITGSVFGGLPVSNALQTNYAGSSDAFALKLNASGTALVFSTYLGGSGTEVGSAIASDSTGNTWVTGSTASSGFPTSNPYQGALKGLQDAFITRISPAGALLYSTYLGTTSAAGESGLGVAVDSSGRGCASGSTSATDFPVVNAAFPSGTLAEGWVVCFQTDHSVRFSLPLQFRASAIAVSATGRIAAAGEGPAAFQIPVLNPVQAAPADFFRDAFFTVLESSGSAVMASYLGGADEDFAIGTAFDPAGALYVAGRTNSSNFLRTSNAAQATFGGTLDAFAAKIDLGATSCTYVASPAVITAPAAGLSSNMSVTTGATCPWNVRLSNAFFTVPSPNTINSGNGNVAVTVPAWSGATPRMGGIQLPDGQGSIVYQHGSDGICSITATTIGSTVNGSLSASSCKSPYRVGLRPQPPSYVTGNPAYSQLFSFQGTAGQKIAIDLSSTAFDPYVYLFSPGGTIISENDDQTVSQKTGATNSRIPSSGYLTLPTTGTYYVDVTTFLENAVGAFTLRITQEQVQQPTYGAVRFVPVVPCRITDTRNATGPFGGPIMTGGQVREFAVPSSSCGIPSTAKAYSLNVTVVPSSTLGYLTLWPAGAAQPFVSTLNSFDGSVVANAAIVPAGTNGAIDVFVTDATHVILDINGYFVSDTTGQGLSLYTAPPCRIADTRIGSGLFGAPAFTTNQTRDFPIPQSSCAIPSSAQAYSMNVTVVPPAPLSFLTAWPTGQTRPFVSTLNSFQGAVVANAAIVPAGTNGAMSVFVTDATDVVLDINGYFAPPGSANALRFFPVAPCRVADTRLATGTFGGPTMTAGATRDFPIPSSACGIPSNAQAYSLNVTVVPQEALPFLTAWPAGSARPLVSTLNSFLGKVVANAAIVPAGSSGAISVYVTGRTDVVLDINGYFAP